MKKDEVKDALLTLVLVLVLQGDFQQSKDYIQKLSETCAQSSSGDRAFGSVSAGAGDAVPMQGASEFSSLLVDFVVCARLSLSVSLFTCFSLFSPTRVVLGTVWTGADGLRDFGCCWDEVVPAGAVAFSPSPPERAGAPHHCTQVQVKHEATANRGAKRQSLLLFHAPYPVISSDIHAFHFSQSMSIHCPAMTSMTHFSERGAFPSSSLPSKSSEAKPGYCRVFKTSLSLFSPFLF